MNPAALLARLTARGYTPVSHRPTRYPETWPGLDGPAGTLRIVTHPGDGGQIDVYGIGPRPPQLPAFEIRLSASTPETVTVATLNAAETWLASPAATP
jgi:hypothetical protein